MMANKLHKMAKDLSNLRFILGITVKEFIATLSQSKDVQRTKRII